MKNKKGKITLYLMRHGETILNRAGRTQGWCDGVLTKEGIDGALKAGKGLQGTKFKAVYSSDLGRAVKTAEIVINENEFSKDLKLQQLEGLREVYFGKYEAGFDKDMFSDILNYLNVSSLEEAVQKYELQKEYCNSCAALDETNEAEDYDTIMKRVMKSINDICLDNFAENESSNILLVIHGGIIRLIIDYLDKSFNIRSIDNSSISKIEYENGSLKVISVNDTDYCN